jgi:hypothetical protein
MKKHTPTMEGRCSMFLSYYCPSEIFNLMFRLSEYERMKRETAKASKKLTLMRGVRVRMNFEFIAYAMAEIGFSMGYVMGQHYNIKDREHLPVLKKLFFDSLNCTDRREAERKGLPYIGKNQKKIEKKAA